MSRLIKKPIEIPAGIEINNNGSELLVKAKGKLVKFILPSDIFVIIENNNLSIKQAEGFDKNKASAAIKAMFGTLYANIKNTISGLSKGFERRLNLIGVGYKAQVTGKDLVLNVGYSHQIIYKIPEGVSISSSSPTELVLTSDDKMMLGQVASEIRNFRPPEPYQGKGIRYSDEVVFMKEAKKK